MTCFLPALNEGGVAFQQGETKEASSALRLDISFLQIGISKEIWFENKNGLQINPVYSVIMMKVRRNLRQITIQLGNIPYTNDKNSLQDIIVEASY